MNKRTKERINKKIIQKTWSFPKKKRADNKNLNENHDLMCLSRLNCLLYYFVRNVFAKGDEAGPEKMRNSSFGRKKTSLLLALHLFRLLLLWRCLEFTIAPKFSLAPLSKRFRCWINLSKLKLCLPVIQSCCSSFCTSSLIQFYYFSSSAPRKNSQSRGENLNSKFWQSSAAFGRKTKTYFWEGATESVEWLKSIQGRFPSSRLFQSSSNCQIKSRW